MIDVKRVRVDDLIAIRSKLKVPHDLFYDEHEDNEVVRAYREACGESMAILNGILFHQHDTEQQTEPREEVCTDTTHPDGWRHMYDDPPEESGIYEICVSPDTAINTKFQRPWLGKFVHADDLKVGAMLGGFGWIEVAVEKSKFWRPKQ